MEYVIENYFQICVIIMGVAGIILIANNGNKDEKKKQRVIKTVSISLVVLIFAVLGYFIQDNIRKTVNEEKTGIITKKLVVPEKKGDRHCIDVESVWHGKIHVSRRTVDEETYKRITVNKPFADNITRQSAKK